jgi:amino acid permease
MTSASSLFYVLGVFIAGLLVPYNHPGLSPKDSNNGIQYVQSSPFIIAMQVAGIRIVRSVIPVYSPYIHHLDSFRISPVLFF